VEFFDATVAFKNLQIDIKDFNLYSESVKEHVICVTKELEEHLDVEFRNNYEINTGDIRFHGNLRTDYRKQLIDLKRSTYKTNIQVVTKSYMVDSVYLLDFSNELLVHKIISKSDKAEYFSEFIGFILGNHETHPYYGTIVFKLYNLGDLSDYAVENEDRTELLPEEIQKLTDIAHQIARGLFLQLVF